MFSGTIIEESRSINATSRVIRMTIVSDATNWSVTEDSRVAIYDGNMFIIQATADVKKNIITR